MNNKTIRTIVLLASIVLLGLILIQIFWVRQAYKFTGTQFDNKVNLALIQVATQVYKKNQDSTSNRYPVEQMGNSFYVVNINGTVEPAYLENLLRSEFRELDIPLDFEYAIYDCFSDSVLYRHHYPSGESRAMELSEIGAIVNVVSKINITKDSHKFGVYFPKKDRFLVSQMNIMVFSTCAIGVVFIFFIYLILVIFKQKRLSEMKTDFINNMTHEFKTPISTISVSTDQINKDTVIQNPDKIRNYARIIKEENNRLKSQVDRILQIAMLDSTSKKLKLSEIHVHDLISEVVDKICLLIEQKNAVLDTYLQAPVDLVDGDKDHLTNVLFNLLENALKYSKENPKIIIRTYNRKNRIYVSVTDNGIGIPRAAQKHIFEKFYRVPTGNMHNVKGFGLGLNYVQNIVQSHQGDITLQSKEGEGTTFTFYLKLRSHE